METIPSRIETIQRVDRENPGLIHSHLEFCMACVKELNKSEPGMWGLNGKRGNRFDLSNDVVTKLNSSVPWGCSIIDIIGGADSPNPRDHQPVWIDQTQRTLELGTVGLFVPVAGEPVVKPEPIDKPVEKPIDINPILDLFNELKEMIQEINRKIENRVDLNPVFDHVTSQAGALLTGVTSEANRVITAVKENKTECKVRNPLR